MNQGNLFTTKYILWSNFQMEKQDKNVEAYQLGCICNASEWDILMRNYDSVIIRNI